MKNTSRNDFGPGSTVVALLYMAGPERRAEPEAGLPAAWKDLPKDAVQAVIEHRGILKNGSDPKAVEAWQRILVQALKGSDSEAYKAVQAAVEAGTRNKGFGNYGKQTEELTREFQTVVDQSLRANGRYVDKNRISVGPQMKAVLVTLVGQEAAGDRQELAGDVEGATEQAPVQYENWNGIRVRTDAIKYLGPDVQTEIRTLGARSRFIQVQRQLGIGDTVTIDSARQATQRMQEAVERATRSTGFEHDLAVIVEKAVDGGLLEGGVLGLFDAAIQKLSGKSHLESALNDLAQKYQIDPNTLKKQYDVYRLKVIEYEERLQKTSNPIEFLVGMGIDKPSVSTRMDRTKVTNQIRRFLARDLLVGLLGAIPVTHVKLGFLQKDVHRIPGYGDASEAMIRQNALEDMRNAAIEAEASSAELLGYLGRGNYSTLRNPSRYNDRAPALSNQERAYIQELKAAAEAIGISIYGADGKSGFVQISVRDADLLYKHSFNFFERIFGNARAASKARSIIRDLDNQAVSTTAKVHMLKELGGIFEQEVQDDFGGKKAELSSKNVLGNSWGEFENSYSYAERRNFARRYGQQIFAGYRLLSRKGNTANEYNGLYAEKGGQKYEQNEILFHALSTNPDLLQRFSAENPRAQTKANERKFGRDKYSERMGLVRQFSRSSHYLGTLLKAQNLHEQGANTLEQGNRYERELMGLLSRFTTFQDLKGFDLVIGKDVEGLLQKYYNPGRKTEGRSLALVRELAQNGSFREWAKNVANYLNGDKTGYMRYARTVLDSEAQGLTTDAQKRLEEREGNKYAGDLDKILGSNPSPAQLAHYFQHTQVNGEMLSGRFASQIHRLTGALISPSEIIQAIAANAKKGTISGRNTAFNTSVEGQTNWRGGAYTFTVPAKEPYTVLSAEGRYVTQMAEYTFGIKPGCANLVILDATGKQIDIREIIANDNFIQEHGRMVIAIPVNGGGSKGGEKGKEDVPFTPGPRDPVVPPVVPGKEDVIINFGGGTAIKEGATAGFGGVIDASAGGLTENTGQLLTDALTSGATSVVLPGGFKP